MRSEQDVDDPALGVSEPRRSGSGSGCAAATWRAALITATPTAPTNTRARAARSAGTVAAIHCPIPVIGMALIGLAGRLGARARLNTREDSDLIQLASPSETTRLVHAAIGAAAGTLPAPPPPPVPAGADPGRGEHRRRPLRRDRTLPRVAAALTTPDTDPALTVCTARRGPAAAARRPPRCEPPVGRAG